MAGCGRVHAAIAGWHSRRPAASKRRPTSTAHCFTNSRRQPAAACQRGSACGGRPCCCCLGLRAAAMAAPVPAPLMGSLRRGRPTCNHQGAGSRGWWWRRQRCTPHTPPHSNSTAALQPLTHTGTHRHTLTASPPGRQRRPCAAAQRQWAPPALGSLQLMRSSESRAVRSWCGVGWTCAVSQARASVVRCVVSWLCCRTNAQHAARCQQQPLSPTCLTGTTAI